MHNPSAEFKAVVNRAQALDKKIEEVIQEMGKIKEALTALKTGATKPEAKKEAKKKGFWDSFWEDDSNNESDDEGENNE